METLAYTEGYRNDILCEIKEKTILYHTRFEIPRHFSKKNSKTILGRTRKFIGNSKEFKAIEEHILLNLRSPRNHRNFNKPISIGVRVVFLLFCENYLTQTGRRNLKLIDLSNSVQIYEDCLEKAEIIENDTMIESIDGSKRLPWGKNEIEIIIVQDEASLAFYPHKNI